MRLSTFTVTLCVCVCEAHRLRTLVEENVSPVELMASSSWPNRRMQVRRESHKSRHALATLLVALRPSFSSTLPGLGLSSRIYIPATKIETRLVVPSMSTGDQVSEASMEARVESNAMNASRIGNTSMQQLGLAGLAGSAAAATAISTAGGVCVGGGCAVAGGVAAGVGATTAGTGIAAGAVGLNSLLTGGVIAFASLLAAITGGSPENLASMVASATPMEMAVASGRPKVIEFYRQSCTHCNEAAPRLAGVEKLAKEDGIDWVMLDTDDHSANDKFIVNYGVYNLPHFEFIDSDGTRKFSLEEEGPVDIQRVTEGVEMLRRSRASLFPPS